MRTPWLVNFCALIAGAAFLSACSSVTQTAAPQTSAIVETAVSSATAQPSLMPTLTPTVMPTPTITPTPTQTPPTLPQFTWKISKPDREYKSGLYTSLALNKDGAPYIAYLDDGEDDLRLTWRSGTNWLVQKFETSNVDGFFPSIVFDQTGQPHLVRFILSAKWLAVMHQLKGGSWDVQAFIPNINVGGLSQAIDHEKTPHENLLYQDKISGELRFARYRSSGWRIQTVDKTTDAGKSFPLVLDGADQPYIAYFKPDVGLIFATRLVADLEKKGSWDMQVVQATTGLYPSLALDEKHNPRLSYYDQNEKSLKHACRQDDKWLTQVVDNSGSVGMYSSMAIDKNGAIHLSYYDEQAGALKYATGKPGEDTCLAQWLVSIVDSDSVGLYTSLALDNNGAPRISYYDRKNRGVKFAEAEPK